MRGTKVLAVAAAVAAIAFTAANAAPLAAASAGGSAPDQSLGYQRRIQDYLVVFEFQQTNPTKDQVTIIFTNSPVAAGRAPSQVFGDDIVAEFSFSGRDYPTGPVKFSRRVRDKSFLDCRYIRVVNHGTNRWFPTTITLVVDGQTILQKVSMTERKGGPSAAGIERWNRDDWGKGPVYWEGELQRYRPRAAS
jgi:hypothetical protein